MRALPLIFALTAALPVWAQGRDQEARRIFEEGVELFRQGDYRAAIGKFRASYALSPNSKILLNLGTALRRTGQEVEAFETYALYLRTAEPEPARRAQIEKALDELRARLGMLILQVNEDGASLYVDGVGVGVSPLKEPIPVALGMHRVEATKPNLDKVSVEVEILRPETRAVAIDFKRVREVAPSPAPVAVTPIEPAVRERTRPLPPPDTEGEWLAFRAIVDAEALHRGFGFRAGLALSALREVELSAEALVARSRGVAVGVAYSPWPSWRLSPAIHAALDTWIVDDQARIGVRGGLRARWTLVGSISALADVAVQHLPSVPSDRYERTFLLLGLGLSAQLF